MKHLIIYRRLLQLQVLVLGLVVIGYGIVGIKSAVPSHAAASVVTTNNVAYGGATNETMDIYRLGGISKAPVVAYIHGGGWFKGDKNELVIEATQLAQAGFVVFTINYPLDSPTVVGYPMEVNATQSAIHWVISHASNYGGDSSRLGLVGGSAGGHLVDLDGLQMNTANPGTVKAVVALSGISDIPSWVTMIQNLQKLAPTNTAFSDELGWIQNFMGCPNSIQQCSLASEQAASPLYNITNRCPAFELFNSSAELVPYPQAVNFNNALLSAGCSSQLHELTGSLHAEFYWGSVESQVVSFLSQKLAASSSSSSSTSASTGNKSTGSGTSTVTKTTGSSTTTKTNNSTTGSSSTTQTSNTGQTSSGDQTTAGTGTSESGKQSQGKTTSGQSASSSGSSVSSQTTNQSGSVAAVIGNQLAELSPTSPKHLVVKQVAYSASGTALVLIAVVWALPLRNRRRTTGPVDVDLHAVVMPSEPTTVSPTTTPPATPATSESENSPKPPPA